MWPLLLDMTKDESLQSLRSLELEAYAGLITALRAQGPLNQDKLRLLKNTGCVLNISQERHKAEIRRVVNDEKLTTIAYHVYGESPSSDEWAQEGRRLVPLMPRSAPQTAYTVIADDVADTASLNNEQLPLPVSTERKRTPSTPVQNVMSESMKSVQFRIPEPPKTEETKKRKMSFAVNENSNLAHPLGPPKISKIQQIYRQRTKAKMKEQLKIKQEHEKHELLQFQQQRTVQQQLHHVQQPKLLQKLPLSPQPTTSTSPKVNIIQNVSLQPPTYEEETVEQIRNEISTYMGQKIIENNQSLQPGCSNENQAPRHKQIVSKINPNISLKNFSSAVPGPSVEIQKTVKICPSRKTVTKPVTPGQKLIIVSNAQSITSSSILQRTLTIPFVKNISVKNLDKFKIVTTTTNASNLQLTNALSTNTISSHSAKHKVVTVRTGTSNKKLIPFAHLQALNAKGSIKMLPIGGKIVTKAALSTSSSPLYIMNSTGNMQPLTKCSSSSSTIMSTKFQDTVNVDGKPVLYLKNADVTITPTDNAVPKLSNLLTTQSSSTNLSTKPELSPKQEGKSSVLSEILKASGVISSDTESFNDDIETQITQLTAIPQTVPEKIMAENTQVVNINCDLSNSKEVQVNDADNGEISNMDENTNIPKSSGAYIMMDQFPQNIVNTEENQTAHQSDFGSLDPTTGQYTVETVAFECGDSHVVTNEDSFIVEIQNTDMPDINVTN